MEADAKANAEKLKRKKGVQGDLAPLALKEYTEADPSEYGLIPSPATGRTRLAHPTEGF